MNRISFLNEKEQAAADKLLTLIAGIGAESGNQTDVEALADSYQHIVGAASIRHHSIHSLPHLSDLTAAEKAGAMTELQNAREDLAEQRKSAVQ